MKLRPGVLVLTALFAQGCGTLYPEVKDLRELTSDTVLIVGKIELHPPLGAKEQKIKLGTFDPMGVGDNFRGRAILHFSETPKAFEQTNDAINPELEKYFFYRIPKNKRFMTYGSIYTRFQTVQTTKRGVVNESEEIVMPPMSFDIRPADQAIYVGTFKMHRDEFNEVTRAEIVDEYLEALMKCKTRFGNGVHLRKSLGASIKSR